MITKLISIVLMCILNSVQCLGESCISNLECSNTACCRNNLCVDNSVCQNATNRIYVAVGVVGGVFILATVIYFICSICESQKEVENMKKGLKEQENQQLEYKQQ